MIGRRGALGAQAQGFPEVPGLRMHDLLALWRDDAQAILSAMYQDKKVEGGALTFVLMRGIGEAFVAKGVDAQDVRAFLDDELTRK